VDLRATTNRYRQHLNGLDQPAPGAAISARELLGAAPKHHQGWAVCDGR
jgi:hypothetical protein